jgi:hypothetical protein
MEDVLPKEAIEKGMTVPKIDSLILKNGFKCSECGKCFGAIKSCKNHISSNHKAISTATVEACTVQRLQNLSTSPYFSVYSLPEENYDCGGPSITDCISFLKSSHCVSISHDSDNIRAQSLLCKDMYFSDFLNGISDNDVQDIMSSMCIKDNELLLNSCIEYVNYINRNISKDNRFICRCLEMYSGSSKAIFGRLQEYDTVKTYGRILFRTITCLAARGNCDAKKVVNSTDSKQLNSQIFSFCFRVVFQKLSHYASQSELILEEAIIFLSMKNKSILRNAGDLSKDMSALKFILKGTALLFLTSDTGRAYDPKEFALQYLSQENQTNFDLVCDKKALFTNISRQTPFVPRIQYNLGDPTILTIDGHTTITLEDVKIGFRSVLQTIEDKMTSILPNLKMYPGIERCQRDLTGVYEDGYSFITDEANNLFELTTKSCQEIFLGFYFILGV